MANLNKVILIGNLTRDPDARRTAGGTSVCSMSMAVNRRWRDAQGETKEEVTFVDVDAWGKQADFCRDYLSKGTPVVVEGRLKMDTWEDKATGDKRSKLKVVIEHVQSLSPRPNDGQQGDGNQGRQYTPPSAPQAPTPPPNTPPPFPESNGTNIPQPPAAGYEDQSIDDIPF